MTEEHIRFEELGPNDTLDQEHLSGCIECRQNLQRIRFLEQLASAAPPVEAPPYFAGKVTRLAVSKSQGFWEVLDLMARRMVPGFAALVLVTGFLLYRSEEAIPPLEDSDSLVWMQDSEDPVPQTLDEMLLVLAQTEWDEVEGNEDAEQH